MITDEKSSNEEGCFICGDDASGFLYYCGGCRKSFCRKHSVFPYDDCGIRPKDINYRSCCANCAIVIVRDLEKQLEELQDAIEEARE